MNKRLIVLPILIAALLLATGCPGPAPIPEPERADSFSAYLEPLAGYGSVAWPSDAVIRILPENATGSDFRIPFAGSTSLDGSSALFQSNQFEDYDRPCLALWPENLLAARVGNGLTVSLPQTRFSKAEGFDLRDMPMIAWSGTDAVLKFYHLCNVVEVSYDAMRPLRAIQLRSLKDEALWGDASVVESNDGTSAPFLLVGENPAEDRNMLMLELSHDDAGEPGAEPFVTGSQSVVTSGTLTGNNIPGRKTVCFIVPVGTLQEGFVVTLIDEGFGFMQKEAAAPATGRARYEVLSPVTYASQAENVTIREDVLNKAFYKDIFMDSGTNLTSNTSMPVTDFLGLTLEYFRADGNTETTRKQQTSIYVGNSYDTNGRILYPDGEPRFRMVYVNGGGSSDHGYALGSDGRERYRQFVFQGGAYLGSCAGAYIATEGYSLNSETTANYFGLWPSHCNRLSTQQIYPGHVIPKDSPLLKYYDFGGDYYVDSVRHHNGPCFIDYATVPGTEVLTRFDIPDSTKMHGHPAIIAWKKDKWTGRVIPCGSHPEQVGHNENLILMAGMVRYCLDGLGIAKVKGVLHNGEVRPMTCKTEDENPAFTRIGDKQCHHFVFALPTGARNIRVRLEAKANYTLSLMLAHETFAFKEDAQYSRTGTEAVKELFFPSLPAGTWYVGVQCESTVTVSNEHGTYGTVYSNTGVLNGVPYTIGVTWDY